MKKLILFATIVTLAWMASAPVAAPALALHAGAGRLDPVVTLPAVTTPTLTIPVAGVDRAQLRDTFLEGRVGHIHEAMDIMAPRGTPVIAAVDGTIRKLFTSNQGGLTIYQFDETSTRCYYYAHLDRYAQGVAEGRAVRRGEVIGYVGSTGNASTPHLHFGISQLLPSKEWWKGTAINPYPELVEHGITKRASELPARPSESD
jgi:murein DD-endopeptidase MepM/ murein hydrolase activator NlpD